MRCHFINRTAELEECRSSWTRNERYRCRCLEDVLYTQAASVPLFQRLSIFVPEAYLTEDGRIKPDGRCGKYTAATAPVIFANNAAGYMQMPHTWLDGPRCHAAQYLAEGMVYVTCGCRGRESRDADGHPAGKAPATLVDFKTALRFLRHNRACLPGDWSRIVSVGWSAGGAMSALLGLTGDHPDYDPYLRANGAFMDESDAVYASQIYCPIIDLAHADLAYEWCFAADETSEDSPAGPAETMTPFKKALSAELQRRYIAYLNSQALKDPQTGELLRLEEDGRSGSFYEYLMAQLQASASKYLSRLPEGDAERYIAGQIPVTVPAPRGPGGQNHGNSERQNPAGQANGTSEGQDPAGQANEPSEGPEHGRPDGAECECPGDRRKEPARPLTYGERLLRPENGEAFPMPEPEMVIVPGSDKRSWLQWNGEDAEISSLDDYVLHHRRRMKPCTSFDKLPCDSGENQLFGNAEHDFRHFNPVIGEALAAVAQDFPNEAAAYLPDYQDILTAELAEMMRLTDPMEFIADERGRKASHFRIRVGASDADTSFSISAALALKLKEYVCAATDYALIWDQPHCQADYPGEMMEWIHSLFRENQ